MRVLVAGATGVVGRPTVTALLSCGHTVLAIARKPAAISQLGALGVTVATADALDPASLTGAFERLRPDAVIHQLTALPKAIRPNKLHVDLAATNRLRIEGTRNLIAAARAVGATRFAAQSISFVARPGPGLATESDPLYLDAPARGGFRAMVEAVAALEGQVVDYGGSALRYGLLYGPGTVFDDDGSMVLGLKRRRVPVVGTGQGMFHFLHVHDAALAAVKAIEVGARGVFHIADDAPAPAVEVLLALATLVGAPRPWRVPRWLARLAAGRYAVYTMTEMRAADCTKAKRELGWAPTVPSWRAGFRDFRTRLPEA